MTSDCKNQVASQSEFSTGCGDMGVCLIEASVGRNGRLIVARTLRRAWPPVFSRLPARTPLQFNPPQRCARLESHSLRLSFEIWDTAKLRSIIGHSPANIEKFPIFGSSCTASFTETTACSTFPVWWPPAFRLCVGPWQGVISPDSCQIDPSAFSTSQPEVPVCPPSLPPACSPSRQSRTFRSRRIPGLAPAILRLGTCGR
jgi:hypothetical protein